MDSVVPLPCRKHLFEIPDDVSYLDAAAWSPLPLAVREAGEAGVLVKSRPWRIRARRFPPRPSGRGRRRPGSSARLRTTWRSWDP